MSTPLPNSLGEFKDDVELALDVAVEARRVQAADEVGAGAQRGGEQVRRAPFRHHAALREGDKLNVDPLGKRLAHLEHGFEIGEADVVVDVDVASRPRRAVGDESAKERGRPSFDRQGDAMALNPLGGDALAHAAALDMGQARRAPMRLVEMDMAVDQRRHDELPRQIDALAGFSRGPRRVRRDDEAAGDFHVREASVRKTRVGQNHRRRLSRFAAAY